MSLEVVNFSQTEQAIAGPVSKDSGRSESYKSIFGMDHGIQAPRIAVAEISRESSLATRVTAAFIREGKFGFENRDGEIVVFDRRIEKELIINRKAGREVIPHK